MEFVVGNHNFRLPPVPLFAQIHLKSAGGQVEFVGGNYNFRLPPGLEQFFSMMLPRQGLGGIFGSLPLLETDFCLLHA